MCKRKTYQSCLIMVIICIMISCTITSAAAATESMTPSISLDQAILKAKAHSENLQKASNSVELKEDNRNYISQQMSFTPTAPDFTAATEVPWYNLMSSDLQWQMSKKNLTTQQDGIELDTCNKYWSILKCQENLKVAQLASKSALLQLQNAQASSRIGILSNIDLLLANTQYQASQSTLAAAKNDLDKAFVAFNQVIGLNSDDRPLLTDTVEYKPLEIKSLDYEVASVLENSPTVWLAEQNVNMQEYLKDMAFYTGSYRPYEIRQKEMEQVQLDVASTKKATEQATRSSYYAIKSLEDSYPGALQNVKVAEENLRITKTKFDIGMATVADVASMEKALADAQYTVFQMTVNHEYMKLAFHKPWAASGGAVSE